MNILIFADKSNAVSFKKMLSTVPNTTVLGTVVSISENMLNNIRNRYNPHCIIFDTSIKRKNIDSILAVKYLQKLYPQSNIIVFANEIESELFQSLKLTAVINNSITDIQFADVIKGVSNNEEITDEIISQEVTNRYIKTNSPKSKKSNKYIYFLIIGAIIFATIIILAIFFSKNEKVDNLSTIDEVSTTSSVSTTVSSESDTIPTRQRNNKIEVKENTTHFQTSEPTTVKPTIKNKTVVKKDKSSKVVHTTPSTTVKEKPTEKEQQTNAVNKIVEQKPKTQTQVKVNYNSNNWTNKGKEETKITLSYFSKTLEVGDSVTVSATVTPTKKKVHWSSSDTSVATVKQTGYVKAKGVGTAVITATTNGKSSTCTIKVKKRT